MCYITSKLVTPTLMEMKFLRIFPLYLLNLILFCGFFLGGIYVSCRFMLGLVMEALGYPTGIAAVFPKIMALIAGLGGGFWGLMIAAFTTRFLARQFLEDVPLGDRPILNLTMSSFISFLFVIAILIAIGGDRVNLGAILKILLAT